LFPPAPFADGVAFKHVPRRSGGLDHMDNVPERGGGCPFGCPGFCLYGTVVGRKTVGRRGGVGGR